MDRLAAAFAIAAATLCIVLVHDGRCRAAAARPMPAEEEEAASLDAAAAPESATWEGGDDGDGALRAGKWLPLPVASALAGGLRFPGVLPAAGGASMPWAAGAPPTLAGPVVQLVPPYVGATRQEQVTLWASLFNPFQVRPRLPTAETSVPAEPRVPAIAGKAPEKATMDQPAAGVHVAEPKWGVFLGNVHGN